MIRPFASFFKRALLSSPADTDVLKNFTCNASKFNKYIKNKCCPCPEAPEKRPKIVRAKTCTQCSFWETPKQYPVCLKISEKKVLRKKIKTPCKPIPETFCGHPVKRRTCKPKYKPCPQGYEKMKY